MKNKKFLCLILAAAILLSSLAALAGCRKKEPLPAPGEDLTSMGTHIMTAPDTDYEFITASKTDYTVVIPNITTENLRTARDEFVYLFDKATGIELKVISDLDITHNAANKYISIGETALLKSAAVEIDKEALGSDGVRIITKDKSVFLVGGSDKGTVYAVYDFMQIYFNFDVYYKDCIEIDFVTDAKLKDFDVTDIPDFHFRALNYGLYSDGGITYDEKMFADRMRNSGGRGTNFLPIHSEPGNPDSARGVSTNAGIILPREKLEGDHPEWFSDNGDQWCYTAHGDEEQFELMVQAVADRITYSLELYNPIDFPQYNIATVTQQDNGSYCTCDACRESLDHYGTMAGTVIIFMNQVADIVDEWMKDPQNAEYYREDFTIIFFAYHWTQIAPAKLNETTGKHEPIDDKVILRDNLGIYFAQTYNRLTSIYDSKNDASRANVDAWGVLTDAMYFWTYATNFRGYLYPLDRGGFNNAESYRYFASKSNKFFFKQSQSDTSGTLTAFYNLDMYLDSKLQWNSYLDENELIDKWFKAMFYDEEAIRLMKELYMEQRILSQLIATEHGIQAATTVHVANKDYWPLSTLKSWYDKCNAAQKALEKYKITNPERYISSYYHIESECISPMYIILDLYTPVISETEKNDLIARLRHDIDVMRIGGMLEKEKMGSLIEFLDSL